jgi:hypothetical protein
MEVCRKREVRGITQHARQKISVVKLDWKGSFAGRFMNRRSATPV